MQCVYGESAACSRRRAGATTRPQSSSWVQIGNFFIFSFFLLLGIDFVNNYAVRLRRIRSVLAPKGRSNNAPAIIVVGSGTGARYIAAAPTAIGFQLPPILPWRVYLSITGLPFANRFSSSPAKEPCPANKSPAPSTKVPLAKPPVGSTALSQKKDASLPTPGCWSQRGGLCATPACTLR